MYGDKQDLIERLDKLKENTNKLLIELLKERKVHYQVVKEKQVEYTLPLTPDELMTYINYYDSQAKLQQESDLTTYFEKKKDEQTKLRWRIWLMDWKTNHNNIFLYAPKNTIGEFDITPIIKFDKNESWVKDIKNHIAKIGAEEIDE